MAREIFNFNKERIKTYLTTANCITPLGKSLDETWAEVRSGRSGIADYSWRGSKIPAAAIKFDIGELMPDKFQFQSLSRFEKLLCAALLPIIEKKPVSEDSALIISTTKGNIRALEAGGAIPDEAFPTYSAKKIAAVFGFKKMPVVVSNACVSGLMAISVAKNMICAGLCCDAFVAAADEISDFVLSGFSSFQAMSARPCKPYDATRDGITLGEAAAAAYISTESGGDFSFKILGDASINDANHISGPSRTGEGLFRSIAKAMRQADLLPKDIETICAHGTATVFNDEMEAIAFSRCGLSGAPMNSLKGYFGHTLGAAGLLETTVLLKSARENILLESLNFETTGTSVPLNIISKNKNKPLQTVLKTASGFGGCNTAMIFKKHEDA